MTDPELPEMIAANIDDPRIQAALHELRGLITQRFPQASFTIYHGDDPEGIRLLVTVDVDDLDEVMDTVVDRMVDMQVYEGLPVYVVPRWPSARTRAFFERQAGQPVGRRFAIGGR